MSLLSGSRAGFRADHHERSEVGGAEAEGLANDTGTEPARGLRQVHRGRVRTASTIFVHALTQDFRASSCTLRPPAAPGWIWSSAGSRCSPKSNCAAGRTAAPANWKMRSVLTSNTTTVVRSLHLDQNC